MVTYRVYVHGPGRKAFALGQSHFSLKRAIRSAADSATKIVGRKMVPHRIIGSGFEGTQLLVLHLMAL